LINSWDLREARLHLRPYSNPLFDIAVAAVASPTGAKLAGRNGVGMLSVGATTAAGFDALAPHWDVLTAEARRTARPPIVASGGLWVCATWRRQRNKHIATWSTVLSTGSATSAGCRLPQMAVVGNSVGEMIEFINGSGLGAIGTPEACAAQIERLWKQSNGGFGAYLMVAQNWANPVATLRSYELIAREAMPQFQGHALATLDARARRPAKERCHTFNFFWR
jgi:limonene 1,2-monooxygenase